MKAETAAKKLGVLLDATPEDFRTGPVARSQLNELLESPPEWLVRERATHAEVMSENARVKRGRAATSG